MQRIINAIKRLNFSTIFALLFGVVIVVLVITNALFGAQYASENTATDPESIFGDDFNDLPEDEQNYLIDRANSIGKYQEIEGDDKYTVNQNLTGLFSALPIQGVGFRIEKSGEELIINYSNEVSLNGAFNFLKQYGIYSDDPRLVLKSS